VIRKFGDRESQDFDEEISCFAIRLQDIKKRKDLTYFFENKKGPHVIANL